MNSAPDQSAFSRQTLAAALLIVWTPYTILALRFWFLCDDAFISFRFARNLARGLGLTYNPAEPAPVEGYSNFLWTILCAAFEALHADITFWPPLISFLCGLALLALVLFTLHRRLQIQLPVAVMAALLLAASPALAVWATSGLETMPFTLLLFACFYVLCLARGRVPVPAAAALMLALGLVRVEGIYWLIVVIGLAALSRRLARKKIPAGLVPAAAVALGAYALYFAWRYHYYGLPFATTAYAKAEFGWRVARRGADYVIWNYLTLIVPALALPAFLPAWKRDRAAAFSALGMAAVAAGYAVMVGGDFLPMARLLAPALPFNFILIGMALQTAWERPGRRTAAIGAAALGLIVSALPAANLHLVPRPVREMFYFRASIEYRHTEYEYWKFAKDNHWKWTIEGKAVAKYARPGQTYVRGPIGAAGYYSDLRIIDTCGLVNPEVAALPAVRFGTPGHDKCHPVYFFADKNPDILCTFLSNRAGLKILRDDIATWSVRGQYVPDFVPVREPETEGLDLYLFVCRRLRPGEDPDQAWADFDRRLPAAR